MTLLFTFVYSFEDNSNISTNLIVSAYFHNCSHLTHIMYENVQKSFNKTQKKINMKKNEINNNKLIDCESGRINEDLKSLMSSSANTKNTYVNYEKKTNKIIINKGGFHSFFINSIKSSTFSMASFFGVIFLEPNGDFLHGIIFCIVLFH